MKRWLRFLPLVLLGALLIALVWRIANPAETTIHSRLVGTNVPAFQLPAAVEGKPGLSAPDLRGGGPRLLNIFASWCVPCAIEAPVLADLEHHGVKIDAIAIRDRPEDVAAFLQRYGDPFERIGADANSRVQLALGSAGVPESFVIDADGVIRYHHPGPIMPQDVSTILAELEKAR